MPYLLNEPLELAIVAWVRAVLGIGNVEWSHQNTQGVGRVEELALPRAILSLFSPRGLNRPDDIQKDGVDDTFTKVHRNAVTLSVKISASEQHLALADKLARSIYDPAKMVGFDTIGAAVNKAETVQDITEPLETRYSFRASIDFMISYIENDEVVPGEIRSRK